jgi:hypothetical protein
VLRIVTPVQCYINSGDCNIGPYTLFISSSPWSTLAWNDLPFKSVESILHEIKVFARP